MSVASDTLAFFRTRHDASFIDTCVVKEKTGESFSDLTGVTTPTYTTRYSGACLARPASNADVVFGQQLIVVFDHVVSIPWNQNTVGLNMLIDMTSTHDGKLNGLTFVIRGIPVDSYTTRRILLCQENQGV